MSKGNIYIVPLTSGFELSELIPHLDIVTLVDTRSNQWKTKINKIKLQKLGDKLGCSIVSSVRLSESEPIDSKYINSSIASLIDFSKQGNILLFGGCRDYAMNHLVYDIAYRLLELKAKVLIQDKHFDFKSGNMAIGSIPRGGYFGNFKCIPVSTEEGHYYNKLIDVMFETKLSKNYILRDFMVCVDNIISGVPNIPDYPSTVIKSGKKICENILEPIRKKWGPVNITYGYQNRVGMEQLYTDKQKQKITSSSPHQWDRGTYGKKVYARIDILPRCVEIGEVSRDDFGKWLMYNLNIDLLMQWKLTNIYCVTISPKPRRVWLEWVPKGLGTNGGNRITKMGENFWINEVYKLSKKDKPLFTGSCSNGKMWV